MGNRNQRLNGLNPLAYLGDNAYQPSEFVTDNRAPTINDSQNFELGTTWLDITTENVWMLVNLAAGIATWVMVTGSGGSLTDLTGNSGGQVAPLLGNINVLGDTTTINIVGNPGTHTLTISTVGTGVMSSLTGNSGGAVFPTAGNTNLLGTGVITVVGNPGTSTLTITPSGAIASSFPTDSGTATPSSGVLNVLGGTAARDINTSGSGNTIHVDLNNAITLGDLSVIGAGSNALSCTTGDINLAAGNIKLTNTNSAASTGVIKFGGTQFIHNFGSGNSFFGTAGNFTLTTGSAVNNVALGNGALAGLTTGANNSALGNAALQSNSSADNNSALGAAALQIATTSSQNTAVGAGALSKITTGSGQNTAIGFQAGDNLATGTGCTLVGMGAGTNYTTTDSNNIVIGSATGTVGESGVTRIGNTGGTSVKCFISGIRGITTGVNDAIAVLVDSAGQLGTVSSSLRFKENVEDMKDYSNDIYKLRPVTFNFKDESLISSGLIAEEVQEVMPQLVANDENEMPFSVKYHELPALLLNEIQKLNKRIEILESKLTNCCKE